MPQQTRTDTAAEGNQPVERARRPKEPMRRSIIVLALALATAALAVFILALGDLRRRNMALSQARWYAGKLSDRLGEGRVLPLNLEIEVPTDLRPKLHRFEWLTREEARRLRAENGRFTVAYTDDIRQVLRSNGRAVAFFQAGKFECEWVSRAEFDRLYAAQQAKSHPGRPDPGGDRPQEP